MRVKSVTERYRAVSEGTMTKKEFVRQMRQQYPMHITQFNGYDDSVQILKNRGLLFEAKVEKAKMYDERPALTYSLDALDRGIRAELGDISSPTGEEFKAAEKKAKDNLEKNPTHYLDLMSGESNKVDKHDREVETKRGKEEVDVFNGMKKAALKEGYTEEQISDAIQKIKERKAGEHEDGTPKSNDEMGDDEREDFYNDLDDVNEEPLEEKSPVNKAGLMGQAIQAIKAQYGEVSGITGIIRDFLTTHADDIFADPNMDYVAEFDEYVSVNYDSLSEKKGKDHDGDGDIDGDDYMAAKDKAIKGAMGKEVDEIGMFHDPVGYNKNADSEDKQALDLVAAMIEKGIDKETAIEKASDKFGIRTSYLKRKMGTDVNEGPGDDLEVKSLAKKMIPIFKKYGIPVEYVTDEREFRAKETPKDALRNMDGDTVPTRLMIKDGVLHIWAYFLSLAKISNSNSIKELDFEGGVAAGTYERARQGAAKVFQELAKIMEPDFEWRSNSKMDKYGDYTMAVRKKQQGNAKVVQNKQEQLKEAVKSIIRKVLTEQSINEAATGNLSKIADDYDGFQGMQNAVNQLENIVTDVESYYSKVREKIQKVYGDLGNITNEEGLKVGGFLAPAIEAAFMRDLKPVIGKGFTKGLEMPKVKVLSKADIDAHNSGERPLGEEGMEKRTMFSPVYESKKK